jgi:hypothetical protein
LGTDAKDVTASISDESEKISNPSFPYACLRVDRHTGTHNILKQLDPHSAGMIKNK